MADLEAIAEYIALDNASAASRVVERVYTHVGQLAEYPDSGSRRPEQGNSRYCQIVEPPCRVFYRHDRTSVYVLHVMRAERLLREEWVL